MHSLRHWLNIRPSLQNRSADVPRPCAPAAGSLGKPSLWVQEDVCNPERPCHSFCFGYGGAIHQKGFLEKATTRQSKERRQRGCKEPARQRACHVQRKREGHSVGGTLIGRAGGAWMWLGGWQGPRHAVGNLLPQRVWTSS